MGCKIDGGSLPPQEVGGNERRLADGAVIAKIGYDAALRLRGSLVWFTVAAIVTWRAEARQAGWPAPLLGPGDGDGADAAGYPFLALRQTEGLIGSIPRMLSLDLAVPGHSTLNHRAAELAGCRHLPMRTGSGQQAARWAPFKWVNTMLGNIKAAITGTYRQLSPVHAPRYLASFAWRFNRRFQLDSMLRRFVHSAARTKPLPYRLLIAG